MYTPAGGGASVAVRVLLTRHDPRIALFTGPGVRAAGWTLQLLAAQVPTRPTKGATIVIAATTYTVTDVQADALGLTWDCDVDA